jgi:signal transduction histidine kinase
MLQTVKMADRYDQFTYMASFVADKIRNPLTGIAQTISLIREDLNANIDNSKFQSIDSCIQKIDSFVEDLYAISQPVNPSFLNVNLKKLSFEVVKQYFKNKEIEYSTNFGKEDIFVLADLLMLQNAINNILDNAAEAIDKDGKVKIALRVNKNKYHPVCRFATISIVDNGQGMSTQERENIFKPFYTTKDSGRGLGLVIASKYIHNHGGTIVIQSNRLGTTVEVNLPILARDVEWKGGRAYS